MNERREFFGHPRGLGTLFFTEMWERLSYYGMRAVLVLFLVDAVATGGYGLDDRTATAIYGLYTAGVYLAGLPGGWVADRILGLQRGVLFGGIVIALGHVLLGLAGAQANVFYLGLAVIVIGTGLLKPTVSALVGQLYPEGGARADAGYTLYYLGVNTGAFLGPLVVGYLARHHGWHAGFYAAAVGMFFGVVQFVMTRRHLGVVGLQPVSRTGAVGHRSRGDLVVGAVLLAAALAILVLFFTDVQVSPLRLQAVSINVIAGSAALYFLYLLLFAGLNGVERRRVAVLMLLFVASAVFWSGFEQAGSSLTLFAERYTQRMFGAFEIPAAWFQSLNATFIVLLAPVFSALWIWLERRGHGLSLATKFALGLLGMGAGFLVMAGGATVLAGGALAAPTWLIFTYLFHTIGELALSPIGMSATTKLSPPRFAGMSMGVWFVSLSLGNLVASRIAGDFDASNVGAMPGQYLDIFWFGAIAALAMLLLSPLVRRWSGGVQ